MGKQSEVDLTVSYDARVLKAINLIGQGLMDLAAALSAPGPATPEPRPAKAPHATAPAEEPDQEEEAEVEESEAQEEAEEEIELKDLQQMAKDLIKAGGRDKLRKILEKHELETVSSAPEDVWPALKRDLENA